MFERFFDSPIRLTPNRSGVVYCALVLGIGLGLVVPHLLGAALSIVLVIGAASWKSGNAIESKELVILLGSIVTLPLLGQISLIYGGIQGNEYSLAVREARLLASVFCCIAISFLWDTDKTLRQSLVTAGVAVGFVALLQVSISGYEFERASGATISVVFGHLAAAVAMLLLPYAVFSLGSFRNWFQIALMSSILAVMLSGTRGALVTIFVVGLSFLIVCLRRQHGITARIYFIVPLIIVAIMAFSKFDVIEKRTAQVIDDWKHFRSGVVVTERIKGGSEVICGDAEEFLIALLELSEFGGKKALAPSVEKLPVAVESKDIPNCNFEFAIYLGNSNKKGNVWLSLPERNVVGSPSIIGSFLIKGDAEIGLLRSPSGTRKKIRSTTFQKVMMENDDLGEPYRPLLVVPAGEEAWVIPLMEDRFAYLYPFGDSGIGMRFLLWNTAFEAFISSPVIGLGLGKFEHLLDDRASSRMLPNAAARFDHAHNEMLTIAAERGLLGVIALLLFYIGPIVVFMRRSGSHAAAGVLFVASYCVSGLFEALLVHSSAITFYVLVVCLLEAASRPISVSSSLCNRSDSGIK